MLAISLRPVARPWCTLSFASTLYLRPILDLLLAEVPPNWQAELRLGLQEALVNAAKHGNRLDPSKRVVIRFSTSASRYWWMISDQGPGCPSAREQGKDSSASEVSLELSQHGLPCHEQECGRGLYILHQVFDQVQWNSEGTELRLCKQIHRSSRLPLVL